MPRLAPLAAFALLAACTAPPDGIEPVSPFDPARYAGTWHEIMRLDHSFERGLTDVTATYEPKADGTLRVVNRGWDPETCGWREVEGEAEFREGPDVGSLEVSFFPLIAGGYHVFALDPDYRWAVVAGPSRDYLWILARDPDLDAETRARLVATARAEGFATGELIRVERRAPDCAAAAPS